MYVLEANKEKEFEIYPEIIEQKSKIKYSILLELQKIKIDNVCIKIRTSPTKNKTEESSIFFYFDGLYIHDIKFSELLSHKNDLEEFIKTSIKKRSQREIKICEEKMLSEFARQMEFDKILQNTL